MFTTKNLKRGMLCLFAAFLLILAAFRSPAIRSARTLAPDTLKNWFVPHDFRAAYFKSAPRRFGPFTRWWWPGNDVTNEELRREVKLFADQGFAGVEIQPSFEGLNEEGPADQLKRQLSWDSPSFYEHLLVVMDAAKQAGLIVDLNAGSGWPIGGPQITPDSSLLTLAVADTILAGGQEITIAIPQLKQKAFTADPKARYKLTQTVSISFAKLQAVVAAKVLKNEKGQTTLDSHSLQTLTTKVVANRLTWEVPEGSWKVLTFWSMPDGELPKAIAIRPMGFIADYLDAGKIQASYQYLFGPRSGLPPYYGNPFRAVFNDSYEFLPDRHYSSNFLSFFNQQRGYDIAPYLPAVMKKFYDNAYVGGFFAKQPFPYSFGEQDWRLRYDYGLTVSDLLRTQFIQPSNRWMHQRGLLHRTQAYGVRMDVIENSGAADIPETEQLAGNNSEGFLKLITSGAHLHGKPIISQESFVFRNLTEMTTPQKIRLAADKAFAAGVNQIFYHGTPYKYQTGEFGKEGWNTFSTRYHSIQTFSSGINESWPFWKDIQPINQYIARCQYLLQSGKPRADVLIYFPFVDIMAGQVAPNPTEILVRGNFKGVEPDVVSGEHAPADQDDKTMQWYAALWPLVNSLEAAGITWDFVNDASLQKATLKQGELVINDKAYSSLVVANAPYLQLATAQNIAKLAKGGARLLFYGNIPDKQPSFLNYQANDVKTKQFIHDALAGSKTKAITNEKEVAGWVAQTLTPLKFSELNAFTRTTERQLSDGSRLKFIWNQSNQWQTVSLTANTGYKSMYWLNAENGVLVKNSGNTIRYVLPPYGSIFAYAAQKPLPENVLSPAPVSTQKGTALLQLDKWTIKIGDTVLNQSNLFDWKGNDALKYKSDPGVYNTSFQLRKEVKKQYLLDMGDVYFTADVWVNGKWAGKRLWAPYQLDITTFLKGGANQVEIRVTPTSRNEFIGEAVKGNPKYVQYKDKEKTSMPAGLVGPVKLLVVP